MYYTILYTTLNYTLAMSHASLTWTQPQFLGLGYGSTEKGDSFHWSFHNANDNRVHVNEVRHRNRHVTRIGS